jgi:hypothetical protein
MVRRYSCSAEHPELAKGLHAGVKLPYRRMFAHQVA